VPAHSLTTLAAAPPPPLSTTPPASSEAAQQLASPAVMYAPSNTTPPAQSDTSPAPASAAQLHGSSTISNGLGTSSADRSSQTQTAVSNAQSAPDSSLVYEAASASMHDKKPMLAGLDRHVHVFTREAAAAAEASTRLVYSLSCTWHKTLHMTITVHTLVALIRCMLPDDLLSNPHASRAVMWLRHATTHARLKQTKKLALSFIA